MRVKELIEKLQEFKPDTPVFVGSGSEKISYVVFEEHDGPEEKCWIQTHPNKCYRGNTGE